MPSLAKPVRLLNVDALRGFALFGILVVNIGVFSSVFYGTGIPDPNFSQPIDQIVRWFIAFFFETKFYLLFSFLFGYSFTLQMAAAERAQEAFAPRFLRRLVGLALLGILHGVLLYQGDILLTYSLLGLILFFFRDLAPTRALRFAALVVTSCGLFWLLLGSLSLMAPDDVQSVHDLQTQALNALSAYRGTIATTIEQHVFELRSTIWYVLLFIQAPCAFAMFLLGLAAGRSELLANLDDAMSQKRMQRCLVVGLVVGGFGAWHFAGASSPNATESRSAMSLGVDLLTAPFLTLAYTCALLLAFQRRRGAKLAEILAPAGRMALTNYLMQSVVCAWIFTAWGLRLVGSLSPLSVLLIAVGLFLAQLPLSAWWLRHHAYGPVEWWLRLLTNARVPTWRRGA